MASYSDGPAGQGTGRLLFYLTRLDATAFDLGGAGGPGAELGAVAIAAGALLVA